MVGWTRGPKITSWVGHPLGPLLEPDSVKKRKRSLRKPGFLRKQASVPESLSSHSLKRIQQYRRPSTMGVAVAVSKAVLKARSLRQLMPTGKTIDYEEVHAIATFV